MPKRTIVKIEADGVYLTLTNPKSKVRIADESGNHIRKPAKEAKNCKNNYVEWMITNKEIQQLINHYLIQTDKTEIKNKIIQINKFLKGSEYDTRVANKKKMQETFMGFDIYEYNETYHSFEKFLNSGMGIKLTFKEGDYNLAVSMYILFPFFADIIEVRDKNGEKIPENECIGSKAHVIWHPTKEEISQTVESLSRASEKHKTDLVNML